MNKFLIILLIIISVCSESAKSQMEYRNGIQISILNLLMKDPTIGFSHRIRSKIYFELSAGFTPENSPFLRGLVYGDANQKEWNIYWKDNMTHISAGVKHYLNIKHLINNENYIALDFQYKYCFLKKDYGYFFYREKQAYGTIFKFGSTYVSKHSFFADYFIGIGIKYVHYLDKTKNLMGPEPLYPSHDVVYPTFNMNLSIGFAK